MCEAIISERDKTLLYAGVRIFKSQLQLLRRVIPWMQKKLTSKVLRYDTSCERHLVSCVPLRRDR